MINFSCHNELYHEINFELVRGPELYLIYFVCSHQPLFVIKSLFNEVKELCRIDIQARFANIFRKYINKEGYLFDMCYLKHIFELYIEEIENAKEEVSDIIAQLFSELLTHNNNSEVGLYTIEIYPVIEYDIPIMLTTTNECNQVGFKIWESSHILNEYILQHQCLFENKVVLELGSGVGISGLAMSLYVKCKEVILSDYDDEIIKNMKNNIELNKSNLKCEIKAIKLDWFNYNIEDTQCLGKIDVIIGADIIYDVDLLVGLVPLLSTLSQKVHDIILAVTIRNIETFERFLKLCFDNKLKVDEEVFDISKSKYFPYVCILKSLQFKIVHINVIE